MSDAGDGDGEDVLMIHPESDGENENGKRRKSESVLLPKLVWPQMTKAGKPFRPQVLGGCREEGNPWK